jgi:hypothetical protein
LVVRQEARGIERLIEVADGTAIKGVCDEHCVSISADGRTWIRKRVITTGDQPLVAEAVSWLLAKALRIAVPQAAVLVAADHNDTSWLSQEITPMLQWDDREAKDIVNLEELGKVIALDALTLNNDRHQGNLLVQATESGTLRLWAIDSGNALVGWPDDFAERRDEIPDPAVLPIRHVIKTSMWQHVVASAYEAADAVSEIDDAWITAFVDEACQLGREPKAARIDES